MSLTSYRAAPPRVRTWLAYWCRAILLEICVCRGFGPRSYLVFRRGSPFRRSGGDLLSRALRRSTIGAEAFHVRVREGIGCSILAMTARPSKRRLPLGLLAIVRERSTPDVLCRDFRGAEQALLKSLVFSRFPRRRQACLNRLYIQRTYLRTGSLCVARDVTQGHCGFSYPLRGQLSVGPRTKF